MGTEELLAIFRTTPTPAILLLARSREYRVFEVNDAFLDQSFQSRDQIIGTPLQDILPPADGEWDHAELLASLEIVKKEKKEQRMKVGRFQVPRKNGRGFVVRYYIPRNIPILDSGHEVAFIMHVLEEATLKDKDEHALGFSEAQLEAMNYRSLFDQNPDTVFSMDASGNFTSVNDAASKLTGYPKEVLLTMHFSHITDPSETGRLEQILIACLRGQPSSFETRGYHASGQLLEFSVTVMPVVRDGEVDGVYGIVKDITEQKKLEREKDLIAAISDTFSLEDSSLNACLEQTLHALCSYTHADAGELWLISMDQKELTLTTSYVRNGTPDREVTSLLKDDPGMVARAWAGAEVVIMHDLQSNPAFSRREFARNHGLQSGIAFPIAFKGRVIAVFAFFARLPHKIDQFQHLSPNLMNQLATHIQRKKAEQELNLYFLMSPDMIGFLAHDGYFKKVNPAFRRVLGYSQEELLNTPFRNFVHPDDLDKTEAELSRIFDLQGTDGFENRYITRDGQIRWLSWTCTLLEQDRMILTVARDTTQRKFLEQTVDLQQRRFASLYQEAPVSMCILKGSDHVFESANAAYYELTARTPDIIGKPVRDVFPELCSMGYFDWLAEVYRTGKTYSNSEVLLKVVDRNGNEKENYISFMYQPYYNYDGAIEGIFYFGVDVTREVLARKKVEQSERRYMDLIENLPAAVYTTDTEGRIRLFNKAAVALFGCEPETGTPEWSPGVRLYDAEGTSMPFSTTSVARAVIGAHSANGDLEITIRRADGTFRNVIFYTLQSHSTSDQLTGSINVLIDITERKRSEEELRKLSLVGTRTNNLVVISNTSGTIDWVNDAFCRFLELPKEEIIGQRPSALLCGFATADDEPPLIVQSMEDPRLMNRTIELEMEYRSRHRGVLWLELNGQPLLDPDGQITHYFVIGVDITEKKLSYDKLKRSKNEIKSFARQLNTVLEEERARIAREFHDEFGQQLTGLKMSLSSLKKRTPGENFSQEMIDPMLHDVDTIIQQIRNFATDLRPAILDTLGLLPSIEWLVRDFEKKSGIPATLKLDVKEEVQLDKNLSICCFRICQEALTNIARHSQASRVSVQVTQGEELVLMITDNGKGILTEKINDPLSMGLLGMRERAHLVGGELTISSPPGEPTAVIFRVRLFPSINLL